MRDIDFDLYNYRTFYFNDGFNSVLTSYYKTLSFIVNLF